MVSAVWGFSVLRTVIFNKIAGVVEKVDKKCRERNQRNLITWLWGIFYQPRCFAFFSYSNEIVSPRSANSSRVLSFCVNYNLLFYLGVQFICYYFNATAIFIKAVLGVLKNDFIPTTYNVDRVYVRGTWGTSYPGPVGIGARRYPGPVKTGDREDEVRTLSLLLSKSKMDGRILQLQRWQL